jgi:hypothetical protein
MNGRSRGSVLNTRLNALVRGIVVGIGFFIALFVAGEPQFTGRWWAITAGVWIAYSVIFVLLQLAWRRYRKPSN